MVSSAFAELVLTNLRTDLFRNCLLAAFWLPCLFWAIHLLAFSIGFDFDLFGDYR